MMFAFSQSLLRVPSGLDGLPNSLIIEALPWGGFMVGGLVIVGVVVMIVVFWD